MANCGDNEFDYLVEEYEMGDFHDMEEESRTPRYQSDNDYNSEEEDDVNNKDTAAIQANKGKDIQGIPWDKLNYSRDKYRETRIQNYKNYSNLLQPSSQLEKDCKHSEKGSTFYGFRYNTRSVKATIVHFKVVAVKQLDRNGLKGNREFLVEVLVLSLLHHPNLVNLMGYRVDGDHSFG